jgi:hypothetical protein
MTRILLLVVATLCATGCTQRMIDATLVSTKNIPAETVSLSDNITIKGVEGTSGTFWFTIIPTATIANPKDAIDDALKKSGSDYLTSAVLYHSVFGIPGILWYESYDIKGDGHSAKPMPADELKRLRDDFEEKRKAKEAQRSSTTARGGSQD